MQAPEPPTERGAEPKRPRSQAPPSDDPRLLPNMTSDERDTGWGERPDPDDDDDERCLREVPPHHGS